MRIMRRRRCQRSFFALVAGGLMLAGALGCSGSKDGGARAQGEGPTTPARDVVRISQGSDLLSFDPYVKLESPSFSIQRNVFDPLVDYDANIKVVPCLAEKWELKDPTHWEFTLRRGVKFHDGQPFTARDAVYSLHRALTWPLSRVKAEIATIKSVEAIGEDRLRIETRIPDAILPLRLVSILMLNQAASEAAIKAHGDDWLAIHANGTGPYRVKLWRKDDRCVLEANAQYWGGKPAIRELEFIPTSNESARMASLHKGEVEVMVNVPARYVKNAAAVKDYQIVKRPSMRLIYLGMDVGRNKTPGIAASPPNPLCDRRVRQAIAAGINNKLMVQKIMGGNADPADQLFPPGTTGYDPSIKLDRPNLERARKLLAEAGYPNGFTVRLDGPNDRYVNDSAILQAVAAQLARIGITVEVNALPKANFFSMDEQGQCSFFLLGWADTNGDGAGTFDHLLHTPDPAHGYGASNTSTHYSNPKVDALCEQASREFAPTRRNVLLQEANRQVMADLPHLPLHFQMDIYAVSDKLKWSPRRDTQARGIDMHWARPEK